MASANPLRLHRPILPHIFLNLLVSLIAPAIYGKSGGNRETLFWKCGEKLIRFLRRDEETRFEQTYTYDEDSDS
jgi:hypothetical protein